MVKQFQVVARYCYFTVSWDNICSQCETKQALPLRQFVLAEDLADGSAHVFDPMAHIQEQGAGAAG